MTDALVAEPEEKVKGRGGWYRAPDEDKCDKKHNVFLTQGETADLELLARFFKEMKSDRNMKSKSNVIRIAFNQLRKKYKKELEALKESLPA